MLIIGYGIKQLIKNVIIFVFITWQTWKTKNLDFPLKKK
jgi:hypothetical protein